MSYDLKGKRVWVAGHRGMVGGAVVRRLLSGSDALVFNLDKCGYASDLASIEALPEAKGRHQLLQLDLADAEATAAAVQQADPDLVMHLAAESHVDRSIDGPGAFISSNVNGTFALLQAARWDGDEVELEVDAPGMVPIGPVQIRPVDEADFSPVLFHAVPVFLGSRFVMDVHLPAAGVQGDVRFKRNVRLLLNSPL